MWTTIWQLCSANVCKNPIRFDVSWCFIEIGKKSHQCKNFSFKSTVVSCQAFSVIVCRSSWYKSIHDKVFKVSFWLLPIRCVCISRPKYVSALFCFDLFLTTVILISMTSLMLINPSPFISKTVLDIICSLSAEISFKISWKITWKQKLS